jgi:hypothetical protein
VVAAPTRSLPLLVLAGVRILHGLFDVLDGDEPDAAIGAVDDQQFFDAELMQELLRFLFAHAFLHRDELFLRHQFGNRLIGIGGEAHVAMGEDADELAGRAVRRALDHGHAGDGVMLHDGERLGERLIRDGW